MFRYLDRYSPEAGGVSAGGALLAVHVGDHAHALALAHRQLLPLSVAPEKCSKIDKNVDIL